MFKTLAYVGFKHEDENGNSKKNIENQKNCSYQGDYILIEELNHF
jgi:hypothetical protein